MSINPSENANESSDKEEIKSDSSKRMVIVKTIIWSNKVADQQVLALDDDEASKENEGEKKMKLFMDYAKAHVKNETIFSILSTYQMHCKIRKAFIFSFLLLAKAIFLYMFIKELINHFQYEVVTKVRTEYESSPVFPRITLCQSNPFTTKFAYEVVKNLSEKIFNQTYMNNISLDMKLKLLNLIRYQALAQVANYDDSDKKKLSHSIEDILLTCKFNYANCNASDFSWTWDDYHGNCYMFNSGVNSKGENIDLKVLNMAGSDFGWVVDVYVNAYEKLKLFNELNPNGLLLKIDNVTHLVDNVNYVYVNGGVQAFIGLKRSFSFYLSKPYSNCDLDNEEAEPNFNSEFYDLIRHSKYEYTQQFCLTQCAQSLILAECNCTFTRFTSLLNSPYQCSSSDSIACATKTYYEKYLEVYDSYCIPQCPLECHLTEFTYSNSFRLLNGGLYLYDIKKSENLSMDFELTPINANTVSECVTHIRIYYESLSYTISTEAPETNTVSFLAQLGGHLGAILGVSFVTFGEVVYLFVSGWVFKEYLSIRHVNGHS
jgi:hypothetical protein